LYLAKTPESHIKLRSKESITKRRLFPVFAAATPIKIVTKE
jgi:hypothetical protein